MVKIVVSMLVRNEASRHLGRTLACARDVISKDGFIVVTDDASDDNTVDLCESYGAIVQGTDSPSYWLHEGRARQRNYDFMSQYCEPGDWVLSLDGDETLNDPHQVLREVKKAQEAGKKAVGLKLLEFWEPTMYRVDGFWLGTHATRLYEYQRGGVFADKDLGGGSEPMYVQKLAGEGKWLKTDDLELHHWGYVREEERAAKQERYLNRLGGHGHNNAHILSITEPPSLVEYPGRLIY